MFFIACTCMPLMLVFRSLRPVEHIDEDNYFIERRYPYHAYR